MGVGTRIFKVSNPKHSMILWWFWEGGCGGETENLSVRFLCCSGLCVWYPLKDRGKTSHSQITQWVQWRVAWKSLLFFQLCWEESSSVNITASLNAKKWAGSIDRTLNPPDTNVKSEVLETEWCAKANLLSWCIKFDLQLCFLLSHCENTWSERKNLVLSQGFRYYLWSMTNWSSLISAYSA